MLFDGWLSGFSAVQSCAVGSLSCSQMVRFEEVRYARTRDFPNVFHREMERFCVNGCYTPPGTPVPISFAGNAFLSRFLTFVDRFLRSCFDRLVIVFLCMGATHRQVHVPISFAGNAFRQLFRRKMERCLTR